MKWYSCKRTTAGRKVFSGQFRYCRKDGTHILFSDGGLAWFKSSVEGSKKFFECGEALDPEISKAVEETYQRTLYTDSKS